MYNGIRRDVGVLSREHTAEVRSTHEGAGLKPLFIDKAEWRQDRRKTSPPRVLNRPKMKPRQRIEDPDQSSPPGPASARTRLCGRKGVSFGKTTGSQGWSRASSHQQRLYSSPPHSLSVTWTKDVEDAEVLSPYHIPNLHCDSNGMNVNTLAKGARPANRGPHSRGAAQGYRAMLGCTYV